MKEILQAFQYRLREPSSYSAFASILLMFGLNVDDQVIKIIVDGLVLVTGVAGIFLKERSDVTTT